MLKITKIISIDGFCVTCLFNDGIKKTIPVDKIIEKQLHLQGIEKLKDKEIFCRIEIGEFGELVWPKIISTEHNNTTEVWNYDISPEFIYYYPTE